MTRILFVCFANLCRSPMAEGVMVHLVREAGLSAHIAVDSAGTHALPGQPAYFRTRDILAVHGIESACISRRLEPGDLNTFDIILAMDRRNLSAIQTQYGKGSADVRLFLSFARQAGTIAFDEVSDPYPDGDYVTTYNTVYAGCVALLDYLKTGIAAAP